MLLAIAGFAIIFAMIYLLFRGKTTPVVAFVLLPLTAAILVGFTPTEIAEFVTKVLPLLGRRLHSSSFLLHTLASCRMLACLIKLSKS